MPSVNHVFNETQSPPWDFGQQAARLRVLLVTDAEDQANHDADRLTPEDIGAEAVTLLRLAERRCLRCGDPLVTITDKVTHRCEPCRLNRAAARRIAAGGTS